MTQSASQCVRCQASKTVRPHLQQCPMLPAMVCANIHFAVGCTIFDNMWLMFLGNRCSYPLCVCDFPPIPCRHRGCTSGQLTHHLCSNACAESGEGYQWCWECFRGKSIPLSKAAKSALAQGNLLLARVIIHVTKDFKSHLTEALMHGFIGSNPPLNWIHTCCVIPRASNY